MSALARAHGVQVGYVRVALTDADYEAILDERLAPRDGDVVVRKVRVGAFSTTDLDAQLRARGLDTLLLAGISTSGVVLSTVRDAHDRDYAVLVLADACADPDREVHEFLLERILPRQASVISLDELRERLA